MCTLEERYAYFYNYKGIDARVSAFGCSQTESIRPAGTPWRPPIVDISDYMTQSICGFPFG